MKRMERKEARHSIEWVSRLIYYEARLSLKLTDKTDAETIVPIVVVLCVEVRIEVAEVRFVRVVRRSGPVVTNRPAIAHI